jgi:hypothetical protein
MDHIYDALKQTDSIIFDSTDSKLREFLSLYYDIILPDKTSSDSNTMVYTDKFRVSILLIPGIKHVWSKYTIPADNKQFLSGSFIIDNMDIRNEYTKRFLNLSPA